MAVYEVTANTSYTTTTQDYNYEFARRLIGALKVFPTAPWSTLGSSCNGTLGTAFSATPDGVDHWSTKSIDEALDAGSTSLIWYAMANPKSGLQIVIIASRGAGSSEFAQVVVSRRGVTLSGAWRDGGTDSFTRPADSSSSPTSDQDSICAQFSPSVGSTSRLMTVANRTDGQGFYAWHHPASLVSVDGTFQLLSIFMLTNPVNDVANPYYAMTVSGTRMDPTNLMQGDPGSIPAGLSIVGRKGAGGPQGYVTVDYIQAGGGGDLSLGTLDPYESKFPMIPLTLLGASPHAYRASMPDIYMVDNSATQFQTWNSKSQIKLGAFLWPWDGVTAMGTDQPGFVVQLTGTSVPLGPVGATNLDYKRFNQGLEIL